MEIINAQNIPLWGAILDEGRFACEQLAPVARDAKVYVYLHPDTYAPYGRTLREARLHAPAVPTRLGQPGRGFFEFDADVVAVQTADLPRGVAWLSLKHGPDDGSEVTEQWCEQEEVTLVKVINLDGSPSTVE